MSLPWIKLYAGLPRHPKSLRLDAALGRKRTWSHVVELWLWASEEAPDGDLSRIPDRLVAREAGWTGNAERFVAALVEVGFLTEDRRLHDWDEHQAAHVEREDAASEAQRRAQNAERQRRMREARRAFLFDDGAPCAYCGERGSVMTIDHVIPRCQGGDESPENLVPACRSCNSRKGGRTPQEAGMAFAEWLHA